MTTARNFVTKFELICQLSGCITQMHFKIWHISYIGLNVQHASTGRFWSISLQLRLLFPWLLWRVKYPRVAEEIAPPLWRQKTKKSTLCVRLVACCWTSLLSGGKFIHCNIRTFSPSFRVLFDGAANYILSNICILFLRIPRQKNI
jgi:hypothetical protein